MSIAAIVRFPNRTDTECPINSKLYYKLSGNVLITSTKEIFDEPDTR